MKIGLYNGTKSLLWDNEKDFSYQNAIRELRFKKNQIKRIVVKVNTEPTYSTKVIIQWFMNQKFTCGQQFTHRISSKYPDKITTVSRKMPYKFRHWIPSLEVINPNGESTYFRPGVHIENTAMGTSKAKAEYNELASTWKYTPEPVANIPQQIQIPDIQPALYKALCNAYELEEHTPDLLDAYIQNKIQITRLPQDEVVYGWFVELGIAPAFTQLDDATDAIIDESVMTYFGKEDMLDDAENYLHL